MTDAPAGGRRLLIRDLEQLATAAGTGAPLRGQELGAVDTIDGAYVLCAGGRIEAAGRMRDLAALDERIRRLRKFRKQLAVDLATWGEQKTATTCSGLCKWIAETNLANEDESVRSTRKKGRRS